MITVLVLSSVDIVPFGDRIFAASIVPFTLSTEAYFKTNMRICSSSAFLKRSFVSASSFFSSWKILTGAILIIFPSNVFSSWKVLHMTSTACCHGTFISFNVTLPFTSGWMTILYPPMSPGVWKLLQYQHLEGQVK